MTYEQVFERTANQTGAAARSSVDTFSADEADDPSEEVCGASSPALAISRLQALLQAMPAGVVVLDGNGVIEEVNRAAAEILQAPLLGRSWRRVAEEVIRPRPDDDLDVSLHTGRRINLTTCSLPADPGQILVLQDVTENRDLRAKIDGVRRLTEMGEMMAALAHQIRTPLASALLYATTLLHTKGDALQTTVSSLIERLRHLDAVVTGMLSFARRGSLQVEPIQVRHLVESFSHCLLSEHQNAIIHSLPEAALGQTIAGNGEALQSVFQNLVTNAIKSVPHGRDAVVKVHVTVTGGSFLLSIADNGQGVSEELRARMFDPFVSGRPDGTGLGLAIAARILGSHGGSVSLVNTSTEGSEFQIALPLLGGEVSTTRNEGGE